ncbi:hypothetical protein D3C76_1803160 [compost metagenome]
MLIGVNRPLGLAPIILVNPVFGQFLQIAPFHAIEPVFVAGIERPSGGPQAMLQIVKHFIRYVNGVRLQHIRGCCH